MISKINRFHGRNALNNAYRHGKSVRAEFLSLRFVRSKRSDYRLAVVVSKKVSKSSVVRNRIRRRIYESVRIYKKEAGVVWPYDMVISVFDERIATISSAELNVAINSLLEKSIRR